VLLWGLLVLAVGVAFTVTRGGASADARDQALLRSVMAGMKTDLVSVQIEPASSTLPGASRHPGQMLVIKSAATTNAGKLRDDWYAGLIGAAYNHQCAAKADHCLGWFEGATVAGRLNGRDARPPFAGRPDLSQAIRAAFASAGLRVTSITFEHPYALAPLVTVRTSQPQHALAAIRKATAGIPWRHVAGAFVQMLDGHGRVFYVEMDTWSGSTGWVRPGLRVPGAKKGATGRNGPTAANGP
jgi:hypothetical protein